MIKTTFSKPRIAVSRCLEFEECRYNGQMIPSRFIKKLQPYVEFIPVCPEVEIGLGIPRDPIKLIERKGLTSLVQPSTKRDLTSRMQKFSDNFLSSLENVDGFILKSASPSCGIHDVKVFHAADNPIAKRKGAGMFAEEVLRRYDLLAIEDEGRLTNFRIREHFLTKIFLFACFREVKARKTPAALVQFQSEYKLLLMAYSQKHMRILGRIVAQARRDNIQQSLKDYENNLKEAFKRNAKYVFHINVLMHALGYFKTVLTSKEKQHFLKLLERYRHGLIPLSAVISIMQSWIIKYEVDYLFHQVYFAPYPEALLEITDSGKGRDGK